jgi:ATP-dependent helicase/DNAse subunit B
MSLTNAANAVHGLVATEELPDRQKHAIDLLLGPYRSGKTWNVIQRILEIHRLDPFAETIVVVPSQRYQTVFEQRLVEALRERAAGGASERGLVGLRIMNFYHLVQMLFRNAGKAFRIVPEQIRPSIIGRVSSALRENNELKALSEISSFIGTQQNVLGLIDEFERAALMPDEVLEQVELSAQTDSRYVELAKIYKHYWQELERLNLMDERQVAFGLRELLNAGLFMPSLQNVFIDGFDRFNKLQLQIFSELARFVNSMVISFDYAEQDGKIHPDYVWKETSYAALNAQLQGQFAVQKFEVNGSERGTSTKVSRFSVTDRFFEMEEIARRVKQSIVVDNVAPEKIWKCH